MNLILKADKASQTSRYRYSTRPEKNWNLRRYQEEDGISHKMSSQLAAMLVTKETQAFITVRPHFRTSLGNMKAIGQEFVQDCANKHSAIIDYAAGFESKPCQNAHICLSSCDKLSVAWMRIYLQRRIGPYPSAVDVREFDHHQNGMAYALKCADYDGEWDIGKITPVR